MTERQDKRNIVVLMGGMSSEHEVSLMSGAKVVEALDRARFNITPVTIEKNGDWAFPGAPAVSIYDALPRLKAAAPDCMFLALHGEYGEDGRIQGLLDLLDLPYTSSGCAASALCMDKVRSKAVVAEQDIRIAAHVALDAATWAEDPSAVIDAVRDGLGFPCVVKPSCLGSSVGIRIPDNEFKLREAIELAIKAGGDVLIEEFISGREVTCAVLDATPGNPPRPLPLTEIRPKEGRYFDYHCKYTPGASEEVTPAGLDPETTELVQDIAAQVHVILGCRIWSRSDFIIDEDGPVWLEVNTIPGLTQTSLFPQAAKAAGIEYAHLMEIFVDAAIQDHAKRKALRNGD